MNVEKLNAMPIAEAREALKRCCGCNRWVEFVVAGRPFQDGDHLRLVGEAAFDALGPPDWLEAFAAHPKIGDLQSLKTKFANTSHLCESEQSGVQSADETTLVALAEGNREYEGKFGFIFIVCASGKSASEMLDLLRQRLPNDPESELAIAAQEQKKITRLRMEQR